MKTEKTYTNSVGMEHVLIPPELIDRERHGGDGLLTASRRRKHNGQTETWKQQP